MVATPWGDSATLRERRLRPGPGTPADDVAENQRQRLYGAMVASVSERGYANTRIGDLVEISGVSSSSFYDQFPDKLACFLGALDAMLAGTIAAALDRVVEGDWRDAAAVRIRTFATLVAAQPAAARLGLVEAYVAGPEATERIDRAIAVAEDLLRRRLAESPEWSRMPSEVASVAVAALIEISRTRLLRGEEAELPEVAARLGALLVALEAPTGPLRSAARPPRPRPEELEASDHAERALRAFEALLTEQAYPETTMEQVAKRATMSVRTLYANFAGKDEVMLAAIDSAGAQALATMLPAFRRSPSRSDGVRAAMTALLNLLAARPNMARLLLVGVYEGGAPAFARREDALRPLEIMLRSVGSPQDVAREQLTTEAILAGTFGLMRRRLLDSGPGSLPSLAPLCTYLALAPALGAEAATAVAESKSYRRGPAAAAEPPQSLLHPSIGRVSMALSSGPLDVDELSRVLSLPAEAVAARLVELEAVGAVRRVEDAAGTRYESAWATIRQAEWDELALADRERISAQIWAAISAELDESMEAGLFEARGERNLVRFGAFVDEQGWKAMNDVLESAHLKILEVQTETNKRLADGEERGFPARFVLVSFELPREPEAGD